MQVSDIKRSNGLLSDIAMYAKDRLFIPTQAMPPIGYATCPLLHISLHACMRQPDYMAFRPHSLQPHQPLSSAYVP